jgi:hypothetical protein
MANLPNTDLPEEGNHSITDQMKQLQVTNTTDTSPNKGRKDRRRRNAAVNGVMDGYNMVTMIPATIPSPLSPYQPALSLAVPYGHSHGNSHWNTMSYHQGAPTHMVPNIAPRRLPPYVFNSSANNNGNASGSRAESRELSSGGSSSQGASVQGGEGGEGSRPSSASDNKVNKAEVLEESISKETHSPRESSKNMRTAHRKGKEPCAFFIKTGSCAYGSRCKFDHPYELAPKVSFNSLGLPMRPKEPVCAFYMKNWHCAFGHTCKYNHPEPSTRTQVQPLSNEPSPQSVHGGGGSPFAMPFNYTVMHNGYQGLPDQQQLHYFGSRGHHERTHGLPFKMDFLPSNSFNERR